MEIRLCFLIAAFRLTEQLGISEAIKVNNN